MEAIMQWNIKRKWISYCNLDDYKGFKQIIYFEREIC